MIILVLVLLSACMVKGLHNKEFEMEVVKVEEVEQPKEEKIRVLIMTDGYANIVHPAVSISAEDEIRISGKDEIFLKAGEKIEITPDHPVLKAGNVSIESVSGGIIINSLNRGHGNPEYQGKIELQSTAEGIVIVNELSVEEYLCGVVPSEMPANYELEALKAQAVCARSYAYRQMENFAYPEYEAHVNDSTDFQVYNNSVPNDATIQAVNETEGEAVYYNGDLVTTYYFSTSCGQTTDVGAWGTKVTDENSYLQSVPVAGVKGDFEKELPWYKWEAEIPVKLLSDLFGLNTGENIGQLSSMEVTKRGAGNVAVELTAVGENGKAVIETESKIRAALGGEGYQIRKNDGSYTDSRKLLPSAFFTIKKEGDTFTICGGGLGHGIGMSQNGANEMAKEGKNYQEILQMFYKGTTIE